MYSPLHRKDIYWWLIRRSARGQKIADIVSDNITLSAAPPTIFSRAVDPIKLRSTRVKYITGYTIDISSYDTVKDETTLKGLPGKITEIPTIVVPQSLDTDGPFSEIVVPEYFPPGSIMLFETHLVGLDPGLDKFCALGAEQAFKDLNLVELNVVLFRSEGEERDATKGEIGAYDVPGIGKLVYCGLEGWMHPLRHVIRFNDLGHSLCAHLRQGTWAFDYISGRLTKYVVCSIRGSYSCRCTDLSSPTKAGRYIPKLREAGNLVQRTFRQNKSSGAAILETEILCDHHIGGL